MAVLVIGGLGWLGVKSVTDLPGEAVTDQGRDHRSREENDKFTYNSNPPTSGPHDPEWIRPGIYDVPQDKYKLIHSLEHGYVVVHYNCAKVLSTPSATFKADCSLAQVLADWAKKIGLKRIIVQPNPEIDKPVVLVAWGRILKMDKWNEPEATKFTKAFHNKGPEQTME